MSKKYELVLNDSTMINGGVKLFRIKALKDFGIVKKGDLGGYIEKEDNLSQEGDAWVSGNARVTGHAWVSGNAWVVADNIKLGSGGIREVEFIAQAFQLIHGGRDLSLQQRPLLKVLGTLEGQGY